MSLLTMAGNSTGSSGSIEKVDVHLDSDNERDISTDGNCRDYSSESTSTVTSLLSRLKAPQPLYLARKRKITTNSPLGKKRGRGSAANDPKSVSPTERVKSYLNEPFSVSNKKTVLFRLPTRTLCEEKYHRASY